MLCLGFFVGFLLCAVGAFASLIPTENDDWTVVIDNPVGECLGSIYFNTIYNYSSTEVIPQAKDFSKDDWFDLMVYYNRHYGSQNVKIDLSGLDDAQKMGPLAFNYYEKNGAVVYLRGFYLEESRNCASNLVQL